MCGTLGRPIDRNASVAARDDAASESPGGDDMPPRRRPRRDDESMMNGSPGRLAIPPPRSREQSCITPRPDSGDSTNWHDGETPAPCHDALIVADVPYKGMATRRATRSIPPWCLSGGIGSSASATFGQRISAAAAGRHRARTQRRRRFCTNCCCWEVALDLRLRHAATRPDERRRQLGSRLQPPHASRHDQEAGVLPEVSGAR